MTSSAQVSFANFNLEILTNNDENEKVLIINDHLFKKREDWIYIGLRVGNKKRHHAKNLHHVVPKPSHLDLGIEEKNFYPYQKLSAEANSRLDELYNFSTKQLLKSATN